MENYTLADSLLINCDINQDSMWMDPAKPVQVEVNLES